jgi:poly-gamma-glutamate synthesis protein (capsule biosynthesis protein)
LTIFSFFLAFLAVPGLSGARDGGFSGDPGENGVVVYEIRTPVSAPARASGGTAARSPGNAPKETSDPASAAARGEAAALAASASEAAGTVIFEINRDLARASGIPPASPAAGPEAASGLSGNVPARPTRGPAVENALAGGKNTLAPTEAAGRRPGPNANAGPKPVRLIFLGDIMVHGQQIKVALKKDGSHDFGPQVLNVKPLLEKGMVVGNFETTLSGKDKGFSGYPRFNSPDELLTALKELGVSVLTLANNHIFDKGAEGVLRTAKTIEDAGFFHTGLTLGDMVPNQPLLLEYEGVKFALLNHTYGTNAELKEDPENPVKVNLHGENAILEGIKIAKEHGMDVIVCLIHWGAEYQTTPSPDQKKLAGFAVENGADLVIGTHPHVLQPMTVVPGEKGRALVAYSLGNFVSNQRTPPRERSVILAVDFEKEKDGGAKLSRVSVAPTYVWSNCGRKIPDCRIQLIYAAGDIPPKETPPASPVPGTAGLEARETERSLFFYEDSNPHMAANENFSDAALRMTEVAGPNDARIENAGTRENGAPNPAARNATATDSGTPAADDGMKPKLTERELKKLAETSEGILDFLGAGHEPDETGYFTLWDAANPDVLPEGAKKSPF